VEGPWPCESVRSLQVSSVDDLVTKTLQYGVHADVAGANLGPNT